MKKYHIVLGAFIFIISIVSAYASNTNKNVFTLFGYVSNGQCVLVEVECGGTAVTCRRFIAGQNRDIYEYVQGPSCGALQKMN